MSTSVTVVVLRHIVAPSECPQASPSLPWHAPTRDPSAVPSLTHKLFPVICQADSVELECGNNSCNIRFFYVINRRISHEFTDEYFEQSKWFFYLPMRAVDS